jgi:hypothetical protein
MGPYIRFFFLPSLSVHREVGIRRASPLSSAAAARPFCRQKGGKRGGSARRRRGLRRGPGSAELRRRDPLPTSYPLHSPGTSAPPPGSRSCTWISPPRGPPPSRSPRGASCSPPERRIGQRGGAEVETSSMEQKRCGVGGSVGDAAVRFHRSFGELVDGGALRPGLTEPTGPVKPPPSGSGLPDRFDR